MSKQTKNTLTTLNPANDVRGLSNPYLGLRSFSYQERKRYAGRDQEIQVAKRRLTASFAPLSLLFVTGESGCGKSSFVQAGLLPALETYYTNEQITPRRATFRPSYKPIESLNEALNQLAIPPITNPTNFNQILEANTTDEQVNLLVIDRFEEVFTLGDANERKQLLALLQNLADFPKIRTHIIVILRTGYIDELVDKDSKWGDAGLAITARQGLALKTIKLDEAIKHPLEHVYPNKEIDPLLIARLASYPPNKLAALQLTLTQLWNKGELTLDAYQNLKSGIDNYAQKIYEYRLNTTQVRPNIERQQIDAILRQLVLTNAKFPASKPVLRSTIEQNSTMRVRLIDELCQAGLLSAELNDDNQEIIRLTHDCLLLEWTHLIKLLLAEAELDDQRNHFLQSLQMWLQSNHSSHYLLEGLGLEAAKRLYHQNDKIFQTREAASYLKRSSPPIMFPIIGKFIVVFVVMLLILVPFVIFASSKTTPQYCYADTKTFERATGISSSGLMDGRTLGSSYVDCDKFNKANPVAVIGSDLSKVTPTSYIGSNYSVSSLHNGAAITKVSYSADGSMFVTIAEDGSLTYLVPNSPVGIVEKITNFGKVEDALLSPDGTLILTKNANSISVWNMPSKKLQFTLSLPQGQTFTKYSFNEDSTNLVTLDKSNGIRLWDIYSGDLIARVDASTHITDYTSTAVGLAVGYDNGDILIRNIKTGKNKPSQGVVNNIRFSQEDNLITIYNSTTNTWLDFRFDADTKILDLSVDGRNVLTANADGLIKVWSTSTRQVVQTFQNSNKNVRFGKFMSDLPYVSLISDTDQVDIKRIP